MWVLGTIYARVKYKVQKYNLCMSVVWAILEAILQKQKLK